MYVVTGCGLGCGTSLMLLMSIQDIGKKYGIEIEGEAVDLGSYKGKKCDFIAASSEIAKQIDAGDIPVVGIPNIIDKAEIERQIKPFLVKE